MYDTIPTPLAPLGTQWVDPLPLRGIVQSVFPTVKVTHRPTAVELREYSGLCVRAARYKSDGSCPLPPGLMGERARAAASEFNVAPEAVTMALLSICSSAAGNPRLDAQTRAMLGDDDLTVEALVVGGAKDVFHTLHAAWRVCAAGSNGFDLSSIQFVRDGWGASKSINNKEHNHND